MNTDTTLGAATCGQRITEAGRAFSARPRPQGLNHEGLQLVRKDTTSYALHGLLGVLSALADREVTGADLARVVESILGESAAQEQQQAAAYARMPEFTAGGNR